MIKKQFVSYSIVIFVIAMVAEQLDYANHWISPYLLFYISLSVSLWYILQYRIRHLLSFDILFLLIYNLISFYNLIVDEADLNRLYFSFSNPTMYKTYIVSLLGLLAYILGSLVSDNIYSYRKNKTIIPESKKHYANIDKASSIMPYITLLYIIYLFITGQYVILFKYTNASQVDAANTVIVYSTILIFATSVFEFIRLKQMHISTLFGFMKHVNRLYLLLLVGLTLLLFFTGNRNESLFIIIPAIVLYDAYIRNITNRIFILGCIFGIVLMVLVGLTRQGDSSINQSISSLSTVDFVRDFSSAGLSNMYLIDLADHGLMDYGLNGIISLLSSVPFLGGFVVNLFDLQTLPRTALLTTNGMMGAHEIGGMGTGLVGDMYFTGKIFFVLIWMFFLGYVLSKIYHKIYGEKNVNVYMMILYAFMISDSIYYVRSEWYTPFRYIGFTALISYIFLNIEFKRKKV